MNNLGRRIKWMSVTDGRRQLSISAHSDSSACCNNSVYYKTMATYELYEKI